MSDLDSTVCLDQDLPVQLCESSSANSSSSSLESSLVQSSSTESTIESDSEVRSLLDVLHSPAPSDLARIRKVSSNPPMQIDSTTVDELASFPFLNNPTALANLKAELHKYMTAVEDLDPNVNILEWWKRHEQDLPYWSSALKDVLLVQPSSAASEQVQQPLNKFSSL